MVDLTYDYACNACNCASFPDHAEASHRSAALLDLARKYTDLGQDCRRIPSERMILQEYYKLLKSLTEESVGGDLEGRDELRETCIRCKSRRNLRA